MTYCLFYGRTHDFMVVCHRWRTCRFAVWICIACCFTITLYQTYLCFFNSVTLTKHYMDLLFVSLSYFDKNNNNNGIHLPIWLYYYSSLHIITNLSIFQYTNYHYKYASAVFPHSKHIWWFVPGQLYDLFYTNVISHLLFDSISLQQRQ